MTPIRNCCVYYTFADSDIQLITVDAFTLDDISLLPALADFTMHLLTPICTRYLYYALAELNTHSLPLLSTLLPAMVSRDLALQKKELARIYKANSVVIHGRVNRDLNVNLSVPSF